MVAGDVDMLGFAVEFDGEDIAEQELADGEGVQVEQFHRGGEGDCDRAKGKAEPS